MREKLQSHFEVQVSSLQHFFGRCADIKRLTHYFTFSFLTICIQGHQSDNVHKSL